MSATRKINSTTILFYDRPENGLLLDKPSDDFEFEHKRKSEIEVFNLSHQKILTLNGILTDEQVLQEVKKRGGFAPLQIVRQKSYTTHLDSFEERKPLPHFMYK